MTSLRVNQILVFVAASTALAGCGNGAPAATPSSAPTNATVSLVRDEAAFLKAAYEKDPMYEAYTGPDKLLAWGKQWCDNARFEWEQMGVSARDLIYQIVQRDADLGAIGVGNEIWKYLCPALDPKNVSEGDIPADVTLTPGARKPRSELPAGDLVDINVILTLPGAGGGGDKTDDGFARDCVGTGPYAGMDRNVSVQLKRGKNLVATGEIGSGIVKGSACRFFVTVLDVPISDGTYELQYRSEKLTQFTADQARESEYSPYEATLP